MADGDIIKNYDFENNFTNWDRLIRIGTLKADINAFKIADGVVSRKKKRQCALQQTFTTNLTKDQEYIIDLSPQDNNLVTPLSIVFKQSDGKGVNVIWTEIDGEQKNLKATTAQKIKTTAKFKPVQNNVAKILILFTASDTKLSSIDLY